MPLGLFLPSTLHAHQLTCINMKDSAHFADLELWFWNYNFRHVLVLLMHLKCLINITSSLLQIMQVVICFSFLCLAHFEQLYQILDINTQRRIVLGTMSERALTVTQTCYYKRSSNHLSVALSYLIIKLMKINPFIDTFSQSRKKKKGTIFM